MQGYFLYLWVEPKSCAKYPTMHRTTLPQETVLSPSANIYNAPECLSVSL